LLNIIIGDRTDSFISGVAKNATAFLQSLPPGIFLGVVLIVVIWAFFCDRGYCRRADPPARILYLDFYSGERSSLAAFGACGLVCVSPSCLI